MVGLRIEFCVSSIPIPAIFPRLWILLGLDWPEALHIWLRSMTKLPLSLGAVKHRFNMPPSSAGLVLIPVSIFALVVWRVFLVTCPELSQFAAGFADIVFFLACSAHCCFAVLA